MDGLPSSRANKKARRHPYKKLLIRHLPSKKHSLSTVSIRPHLEPWESVLKIARARSKKNYEDG